MFATVYQSKKKKFDTKQNQFSSKTRNKKNIYKKQCLIFLCWFTLLQLLHLIYVMLRKSEFLTCKNLKTSACIRFFFKSRRLIWSGFTKWVNCYITWWTGMRFLFNVDINQTLHFHPGEHKMYANMFILFVFIHNVFKTTMESDTFKNNKTVS